MTTTTDQIEQAADRLRAMAKIEAGNRLRSLAKETSATHVTVPRIDIVLLLSGYDELVTEVDEWRVKSVSSPVAIEDVGHLLEERNQAREKLASCRSLSTQRMEKIEELKKIGRGAVEEAEELRKELDRFRGLAGLPPSKRFGEQHSATECKERGCAD